MGLELELELILNRRVGDTEIWYRLHRESGAVELNLLPAGRRPEETAGELTPLASVKFAGDSAGCGFGGGRTMRCSATMNGFRFSGQECGDRSIRTELRHDNGCRLIHVLEWRGEEPVFFVHTELANESGGPLDVELLESFALGGLAETLTDEEFAGVRLHRFRSHWCNEANLDTVTAAGLLLDRYPLNYVICNERYGQAGTLPTSGFHPFGAVEDPVNRTCVGAMLSWSGSWQMEFTMHKAQGMSFSGGLADREFGHWTRRLGAGETLTAPTALLACVRGTVDALCARLVRGIELTLNLPASEAELPVIFNEWCMSWGEPSEAGMLEIAAKLRGLPVKYLVFDAGWYKRDDGSFWGSAQGDWQVNSRLFPQGMAHATALLREQGFIPGIWFEAEVVGRDSDSWERDVAHLLHRDGRVITAGSRRFWNLADPEAFAILEERIIRFIQDNGFGYIKIDYNENVGVGCDHPESPGEGVRQQVLGTWRFFRRLRETNPELVIENCASGGFRLEPGMFSLSSMSSFSDAHELETIPVIAASLHRLMPARQMQIWAVMRSEASLRHIGYLLSAAMLGRLCLSGDILKLSAEQFDLVAEATRFYRQLVPVLRDGDSRVVQEIGPSRRHLTGGQSVVRLRRDGAQAAVWCHAFNEPSRELIAGLPDGKWRLETVFGVPDWEGVQVADGGVHWLAPAPMSGMVALLTRE